jgi:hypothetical protein
MGPKFNEFLYFEANGALEVCGPTNFGPNDISLELNKVTVVDREGNERHTPHLRLLFTYGEMWEADIPNAHGHLVPGMARGQGEGKALTRDGKTHDITWSSRFEIVDPKTFLH